MQIYDAGDIVRISVAFAALGGQGVDPSSIYLALKTPSGVESRGFGSDERIVKVSTGNFFFDLSADLPGDYFYRWFSTGSAQAAAVGNFRVHEWPV